MTTIAITNSITSIGGIVAQISIEEVLHDEMAITDHPVEQGGMISDHTFARPVEVNLKCGWSNSSAEANGDENYIQDIYQQFIDLKDARDTFDILTTKRLYNNMVVQGMSVTTDEKTKNILMLQIRCREVIIVQTQTTTLPPPANQSSPQKTADTVNSGVKQTVTVPPASVKTYTNGIPNG